MSCRARVTVLGCRQALADVRFAPESEQIADVSVGPLCADFVAKLFDDFGEQ
jgi:hypothetical protein